MMRSPPLARPKRNNTPLFAALPCHQLANMLISLNKRIPRMTRLGRLGAGIPLAGRWMADRRADAEDSRILIVGEIFSRFLPVLMDVCAVACRLRHAVPEDLPGRLLDVARRFAGRQAASAGCVVENLWKSATEVLRLDARLYPHLRARMHLCALIDSHDCSRRAVRFFAFETGDRRYGKRGSNREERLYEKYQGTFRQGLEVVATSLYEARQRISKLTCGAITEADLAGPQEASRWLEGSLTKVDG